ncbi:MAG TPA: hypothetical protein VEY12_07905, partial [Thermoplasmata archaeon]|nr:hypothetical protein [Thermoplasmata archaeon]
APPLPSSSTLDGEAYKLRYLAEAPPPPQRPGRYGNWFLAFVIMVIVAVFFAGAVILAGTIPTSVPVTVSHIIFDGDSCSLVGAGITRIFFVLTNSGTRNVSVTVEFLVDGRYAGQNVYTILAGQAVQEVYHTATGFCSPTSVDVEIIAANPV